MVHKLPEPSRRRGRPPAYDREAALAALTQVFWDHGFSATSLDMLAASTAMNRPSLYAAFGDKKAMYLAVLDRYRRDAEAQLRAVLGSDDNVAAAIAALLAASIDFYTIGASGPRGCLAVCTAANETIADADVRGALAAVLETMDGVITDRLHIGIAAGQLPADFDAPGRAALVSAMVHSLAVRARAGAAPDQLRGLAGIAAGVLLA